ncbi:Acyl-CoA N-acyltransferase [Phytophthora cactorum]|nr:Acyl-CoA N-acyltransferase [Phytophthora cactorum]
MLRRTLQVVGVRVEASKAGKPLREQLAALLRANSFSFVPHAVQIDCTEDASDRGAETKNRRGERPGLNKFKTPIGNVSFRPVDTVNVQQLHDINEKLFPVKYNNAFYEYVTDAPEEVKISGKHRYRLCILTIGVLDDYRRSKLGSLLLENVIEQARRDKLVYVYLHVQITNTAAQRFYLAHGFEVTKLLRNYYSQLNPPHCFVLRKQLAP